ncbi:2-phospho-L-lactate guanylyltransferase [Planctomycetaceae bacterium]|nr:2-phospho-L-lactate guanylyltransferase [Planctomycetaceae bacterium]
MNTACPIVVMAKAPVAGFAKTRLIPALGPAGAAELAARLLDHAVEQAVAAGTGPVGLCCTPDANHPAFMRLARRHGLMLTPQGDGDLGARMTRALAHRLAEFERCLLIGADIPGLDAAYLRVAADALRDHDAVFGPALDGGYTLVGLRRPAPQLFEQMIWSRPEVMQHTRERLARLGLRHVELAPLADIDEPADLAELPVAWLASGRLPFVDPGVHRDDEH